VLEKERKDMELTRNDFIKLGFYAQQSCWDRDTLSIFTLTVKKDNDMFEGEVFELIINEHDVWRIYFNPKKIEIVHIIKSKKEIGVGFLSGDDEKKFDVKDCIFKNYMEFHTMFVGKIQNEHELLVLFRQIGCPINNIND